MAGKQIKFGTFSGVFTPSILTILGVIMYMRLGWIVGESGLILAIAIILVAHIISITTGLSIASIATDKKIRTGGIYYILSRSLGLPIGGAIGITMFIGTALSIALYLIGFAENFVGIQMIRDMTGLDESIMSYRIVGTAIVLILVIITLISTNMAIKTQFFILAAIAISLASILIGLFSAPGTETTAIRPVAEGKSFVVMFAIFFPAVTGFTAGVAMSGDLKNPRKNIPAGTLISILTGLIVYIGLTIAFAFFVDRDLLLSDKNFLMKIAWFSPLVIAGIWGATLSSAIGGLLGGPRILQAMSTDRITPKFFGKGYGINNEPRTALLLTFLIAEGGILIGQLDVIASIVSIFFIAAYGAINLAFALEKWASTDFRPSFKISKWVGIIGFVASFIVMFRIDPTATAIAIIILAGIHYFISKKKLELDFGDVWQSVWSSIVRSTLKNISKKGLEERNWRPNIMLFSGGTGIRPYLIDFGKALVGSQGLLSNFHLILNKSATVLLKKSQQAVADTEGTPTEGIFTRRQECKDIYEGIETIASTYGFSGVEPNTVLMGWARHSQDPVRFVQMIKTLSDLDLNIIMLDYDKSAGFGTYKTIDIWCRGGGNNCTMVLSLIKFMWMSEAWKNAKVRLLLINPQNDQKDTLYDSAYKAIDHLRIDTEVKIINNQIEQRPVHEIIRIVSSEADLIFLGVSEVQSGEEHNYVQDINLLCQNLRTIALVKASSGFKDFELNISKDQIAREKTVYAEEKGMGLAVRVIKVPEIKYPDQPVLAEHISTLFDKVKRINELIYKNFMTDIFSSHSKSLSLVKEIIDKYYNKLQKDPRVLPSNSKNEKHDFYSGFLNEIFELSKKQDDITYLNQKDLFSEALNEFIKEVGKIPQNIPQEIRKTLDKDVLKINKGDPFSLKWFKLRHHLAIITSGKAVNYNVDYRSLVKSYFPGRQYNAMLEVMMNWGLVSLQFSVKTRNFIKAALESYLMLEEKIRNNTLDEHSIADAKQDSEKLFSQLLILNDSSLQSLFNLLLNKSVFVIQEISNDIVYPNTNRKIDKKAYNERRLRKTKQALLDVPGLWLENQELNNNAILMQNELLRFTIDIRRILNEMNFMLEDKFDREYLKILNNLFNKLNKLDLKNTDVLDKYRKIFNPEMISGYWDEFLSEFTSGIKDACDLFDKKVMLFNRNHYEDYKVSQFADYPPNTIPLRKLMTQVAAHEFIDPLKKNISETKEQLIDTCNKTKEIIDFADQLKESGVITDSTLVEESQRIQIGEKTNELGNLSGETEQMKIKWLHFLKERITAISDKLSFRSVMDFYHKSSR